MTLNLDTITTKPELRNINPIEERWMITITRYPDGSSYGKMFKLGQTVKQFKQKQKRKELPKTIDDGVEEI